MICSLPILSTLLASCAAPLPFATGYVEGEYVLVAPIEASELQSLPVTRGDRVEKGALLARMDHRAAQIALDQADAALAQARANRADLLEGKRPEEITVIEATLASARAKADEAQHTADRYTRLAETGAATQAQRDDAVTASKVAAAQVREIEANLAVARLPARPQAIAAAEAAVQVAQSARDRTAWLLEKRDLYAPDTGTVTDILRKVGEIGGPTAPILEMLPDGAVKLRLYVPETQIARLRVGDLLSVQCDACGDGQSAKVTYVADAPEFTPPVIYSVENRQKLVYLIEARPQSGATALKPGQIVNVELAE